MTPPLQGGGRRFKSGPAHKTIVMIGGVRMYTKYEKARIISARAMQISMGAPPLIKIENVNVLDPLEIAKIEFEQDVLPIEVVR